MNVAPDKPITSASEDTIGRTGLAEGIAAQVRLVDARDGYVFGLLGPWGSGKTSLINLAREQLQQEPKIEVLDFNPWMFSGAEQLVASFLAELSAQLRGKHSKDLDEVARRIDKYGEFLTPLTLIPFVGGYFDRLRGAASAYQRFQEKRKDGLASEKGKLADALRTLGASLVVVIDDIDRLTPAEVREIFKLVRLTASLPNVIYVLAFDRLRVEAALEQEGVVGRDYLEKIVQSVVDVPAVPEPMLLTSLAAALDEAVQSAGTQERFDQDRWPDTLFEVVRPQIRSVRDVRRFAGSVVFALRSIGDAVELGDLLAIEAVRIFMPDTFKALVVAQSPLTEVKSINFEYREDQDAKALIDAVLESAAREAPSGVGRAIVRRLFPAGERYIGNTHYGPEWARTWLRERRIAHADVLKLYLERTRSDGLIAFEQAEQLLAAAGDVTRLMAALDKVRPEQLEDAIAGLEAFEGEFPTSTVLPLSVCLYNALPSIKARPRGMFAITDSRMVVSRVVLRALRQLQPDGVDDVVRSALPQVVPLSSKMWLIELVGHRDHAGHKMISEESYNSLREGLYMEVSAASSQQLAGERDLLELLLFARDLYPDRDPLADKHSPELTSAILRAARTDVRSRSEGNRAIRRTARLYWDSLVRVFGTEDALRSALAATHQIALGDADYRELVELADRYLGGWRPQEFGGTE